MAAESAAIQKYFARQAAKPSVRFKVSKNGSDPEIGIDYPDELVGQVLVKGILALAERDFLDGIVSQLANAGRRGQDIDEHGLNFMLSVIKGIEARDQLEAMLAAQMAAVHMASMTFAGRLAEVETIPQQDSAERAFKKPTRTFAMQMEALNRYRSGAEHNRGAPRGPCAACAFAHGCANGIIKPRTTSATLTEGGPRRHSLIRRVAAPRSLRRRSIFVSLAIPDDIVRRQSAERK